MMNMRYHQPMYRYLNKRIWRIIIKQRIPNDNKDPRQIIPSMIYDVPKNMSSIYRVPNPICHHYNTLPKKRKVYQMEWITNAPSITSHVSHYDIPKIPTSIYDCKSLMILCRVSKI